MRNLLLGKTLDLMEAVSGATGPLSLTELCGKTGVGRTAASRILSDLVERGYLRKADYHRFEPGIGMLYLGQAALSAGFFPEKAVLVLEDRLKKWKVSGALAAFFNGRIVYLYHSARENVNVVQALPMRQPLYGSNLALAMCVRKFGAVRTRRMYRESILKECPEPLREDELRSVESRLGQMKKLGYAVRSDTHWNLSFPICSGEQIYGISFFRQQTSSPRDAELFFACSKLAHDLAELLAPAKPDSSEVNSTRPAGKLSKVEGKAHQY